ncbi:MAG: PA0069 family radical SAM protein [Bacteroidia bacterium]|nr:PA0069 family radical SAM protein [Bacteroidia bacterium]
MSNESEYIKGRGSQLNTKNKYRKSEYVTDHIEGLDEPLIIPDLKTKVTFEYPKSVVNKSVNADVPALSLNPYQGCEHGCVYCYARNTHQYWGFSAGLDFERNIIAKPDAPAILEKTFMKKSWVPAPVFISGNTDCYQPVERDLKITRKLLEVMVKFRHPVSLITKNSLILRDLDLLKDLASDNLIHVMLSINSLNEDLRQKMEPRTVTGKGRLKVVETLAKNGIPVGVMIGPVIPGLNNTEIPEIVKQSALAGARNVNYILVRLNDSVADIFSDWIHKTFPDRASKVLGMIKDCHGGTLGDSRVGVRMTGEGNIAESIRQLFDISVKKYLPVSADFKFNLAAFKRPQDQLSLF